MPPVQCLKYSSKWLILYCNWSDPCEWRHDKTNKMAVHQANTQISLGICPVWSEYSLSAWRKLGSLATHWAHSEDSDQTGRMPRLILVRWVHTPLVGFVIRGSCALLYHTHAHKNMQTLKLQIGQEITRLWKCPSPWLWPRSRSQDRQLKNLGPLPSLGQVQTIYKSYKTLIWKLSLWPWPWSLLGFISYKFCIKFLDCSFVHWWMAA